MSFVADQVTFSDDITFSASLLSPGAGASSFKAGPGAVADIADSIAIGNGADVSIAGAIGAIVIGAGAALGGINPAGAIAFGRGVVGAPSSVVIGDGASGFLSTSTIVGFSATGDATGASTVFGHGASAGNSGQAFGVSAVAGNSATAIGVGANAAAAQSFCIGELSGATHAGAIALGRQAQSTAVNRCTLGTIAGSFDMEFQIGSGFAAWGATPPGAQPAKIIDATDLPTALTRIAAILDVLEGAGLSAAV